MKHPQFKSYQFNKTAHWQSGVLENIQITDSGELAVLPGFELELIANTAAEQVSEQEIVAMDTGPCQYLYWVDSVSGALYRLLDSGSQLLGKLSEGQGAVKLAMGAQRLWLLTKSKSQLADSECKPSDDQYCLHSYVMPELHALRQLKPQRPILDMAGDCCDGVWWLEGGDDHPVVLFHADRFGCIANCPIKLSICLQQASLDVSCCGSKIAILESAIIDDVDVMDPCQGLPGSWRLVIIDCATGRYQIYRDLSRIDRAFNPYLLSIDHAQHIHLLGSSTQAQSQQRSTQLWSLSLDGDLIARRQPQFPAHSLTHSEDSSIDSSITAISTADYITVATPAGIIHLHPAQTTSGQGEERCSTFITPTLISPDGTPSGWQRADFTIDLPAGTSLEVNCASLADQTQLAAIQQLLQDTKHSPAFKVEQLNQLLQWQTEDMATYAGSAEDSANTRLSYPLHQIKQTHLWMRFRFYTPPGRRVPALKTLVVNYPNRSYLDDLPAVYREDPVSAAALRSFVAIFEVLFGDLDTLINQLPSQIDPDTAPESWLPFLLSWLGFPSADGLSSTLQRRLLKAAPQLLSARGTAGALQRLLEIISAEYDGVSIQVIDVAAEPAPWVLQAVNRGGLAARLGRDTLIVARHPVAFRLGTAHLGLAKGVPLGQGCTDAEQVFAQRSGALRIRIRAIAADQDVLQAIIKIFLPYFIPAHCRYQLEFVNNTPQPWRQRLDVDLRLIDGRGSRLGSETIAGAFRLPEALSDEIMLDYNARLDQGLHLN